MLIKGAAALGVELDPGALKRFGLYLALLKAWNRKMNLTSIVDEAGVVTRHFLDSLAALRFIGPGSRVLDIGAGAGFPGLPLKIASPGLDLLLMDSKARKVHFMRHVIRELDLPAPPARAVAGRAEDPAMTGRYARCFDVVITRAFAPLDDVLAMSLPYLAPNGRVMAMKGPAGRAEAASCPVPGSLEGPEIHDLRIPFSGRVTTFMVFSETRP